MFLFFCPRHNLTLSINSTSSAIHFSLSQTFYTSLCRTITPVTPSIKVKLSILRAYPSSIPHTFICRTVYICRISLWLRPIQTFLQHRRISEVSYPSAFPLRRPWSRWGPRSAWGCSCAAWRTRWWWTPWGRRSPRSGRVGSPPPRPSPPPTLSGCSWTPTSCRRWRFSSSASHQREKERDENGCKIMAVHSKFW